MRRLIEGHRRDERGATAILVAVVFMVLLGFAAIAIDVGAMWSDRKQLQNGADAGSLAIAQACAEGDCGPTGTTAQSYATANKFDPGATSPTGVVTSLNMTDRRVTVTASATRNHWFAQVLGSTSSTVTAQATATWGWPIAGSTLPLAFSICEFKAAFGTWDDSGMPINTEPTDRKISFPKTSDTPCPGPTGNPVPGGFAWLSATGCVSSFDKNGWVYIDPGKSAPSSCSETSLAALQGKTVLVPIFDLVQGTGSNAQFRVAGFGAFVLTGYFLGSHYQYNCAAPTYPCTGADRWIKGHFTRYVSIDESLELGSGGTHFGAAVVLLYS